MLIKLTLPFFAMIGSCCLYEGNGNSFKCPLQQHVPTQKEIKGEERELPRFRDPKEIRQQPITWLECVPRG